MRIDINRDDYTVKPVQSDTCAIRFPVLSDVDFHALLIISMCFTLCNPTACLCLSQCMSD